MQYPEISPPRAFTAEGFRAIARASLRPLAAGHGDEAIPAAITPSDYDLNPTYDAAHERPLQPAAVLVPVVARAELTLLLTQRTDHLPSHAGQIAFPGGKIDRIDASPLAAALREAEEEIGLAHALVEPLGALDIYRTGTGYRITPIVALINPSYTLNLNTEEVVDAFEVPLPFLMNARNHQIHVRVLGSAERRFHAMPYQDRFIWGATAGILKNMHERLFRS